MKLTQFFPLLLGAVVTLNAATLSSKLRTDGTELRAAFGEAAGEAAKACTVNIYAGSKFTGLGTVVSSDGIVVAKNSEIDVADPGTLRIVGPGKRIGRTRILARDIYHALGCGCVQCVFPGQRCEGCPGRPHQSHCFWQPQCRRWKPPCPAR